MPRPYLLLFAAFCSTGCGSVTPTVIPSASGTGGASGAGGTSELAGTSAGGSLNNAGSGGLLGAGQSPGGSAGAAGAGGAMSGGGTAGAGFADYVPVVDPDFDEMPLYVGDPPNFRADAPTETLNADGHIGNVSLPTLRRYAMDGAKATGLAYVVFPGGGYFILDMDTHAAKLAERVGPQGIAVFSVKYRVGQGSTDAPRDALLDGKRAVRVVRENAARWGVALDRVGVIGYSAGSHMALNLADNFDEGHANDADFVERQSSRPSFVGSMSTWSFGNPTSPFSFPANAPPIFFCHAEDDDGAPIALARNVDAQVMALGVPTLLDIYAGGGHSTCHVGDPAMPGRNWPDKLLPWVLGVLQ